VEIDRLPGNLGVVFERRLAVFAGLIDRGVDIFELAEDGVVYDLRPGFIGFAEGDGVGVARAAVAAESFVSQFGDVGAAHDDGDSCGANRVGDAIGLGDHSGHGADADQSDVLIADVLRDLRLVHGLSVAIDEQNFVAGRGESLQQKHPQVWHEVSSHTIVGL